MDLLPLIQEYFSKFLLCVYVYVSHVRMMFHYIFHYRYTNNMFIKIEIQMDIFLILNLNL